jgi:hypothetical protein
VTGVRQGCSGVVAAEGLLKTGQWHKEIPRQGRRSLVCARRSVRRAVRSYFGGAGVNPSRLCAGSGLGFGLGAFLTSFLPLSLLPMDASVPQKGGRRKVGGLEAQIFGAFEDAMELTATQSHRK